ncbi:asparaginyl-tRNA synthetase [Microbotryomycetes sp. JL221]|nr:asparaginyl-tRNA synthetase [Microbotryomycetes sp. JL221]
MSLGRRRDLRGDDMHYGLARHSHQHFTNTASTSSSPTTSAETSNTVTIHGWVKSCRKQKRIAFAVVNDGTTNERLQCVLSPELAQHLTAGCSTRMRGRFVDSPGQGQAKEFRVDSLDVLGSSDAQAYPIQNTKQGIPATLLRKNAHLRPRTSSTAAMLRLRSEMAFAMAQSFRNEGFIKIETPIITSSDCEGAGETFRVTAPLQRPRSSSTSQSSPSPPPTSALETPKYLTVSSQLHLEAIASSIPRVYSFSPAFRAEKSDTSRHLQEFWMLEAEVGFLDDQKADQALDQVMNVAETVIKDVVNHVKQSSDVMDVFANSLPEDHRTQLLERLDCLAPKDDTPFKRMTYTEAVQILQQQVERGSASFIHPVDWQLGLQTEHEKFLAETYVKGPVFVTDYPSHLKPFYMLPSRLDSDNTQNGEGQGNTASTVACFDLLVPKLGELVGGSLREHRVQHLERALTRHGLDSHQYDWYLDLRRFGTTMHGGFGLGWERLVACITGLDNVRDCIAFPRATEGSRF